MCFHLLSNEDQMDILRRPPDVRSSLRDILSIPGTDSQTAFRAHRDVPLPCKVYQHAGNLLLPTSEQKLQ